MRISRSHPRYVSLKTRLLVEEGVKNGITSLNGLIAHGRGEAFDYLVGEKTNAFAERAIEAAAVMLLQAKHPVISVNGNTAALVPEELTVLSELLTAPLEVNLFHKSQERLEKIRDHMINAGAKKILLPDERCIIPYLESDRKYVNPEGIFRADVVFVPLEDGDRTEALIKNGKKIITVDLNPLSRTAQMATVTIVDNIVRTMPLLIEKIRALKNTKMIVNDLEYDNKESLKVAIFFISKRFGE